ncbi:hypothetical protein GIB67_043136 [Kingdonia uniflora]|uniref:Endonuclease/exonuclease/phosphatase domain-containing protein n=1 Tax=Kingdonia uniflora TaxID=39325 RepID=A0A7J7NJB0_9MAGN|nr:hypothetical protein GIB67_043136 [Kingdonia uniflora]
MRFASSSLQFFTIKASKSATMSSSRTPYRGGRNQWGRGFSDRPIRVDSQFWSIRDDNYRYGQGESGDFGNYGEFQQQQQPAHFRQPSPSPQYYGGGFQQQPMPFRQCPPPQLPYYGGFQPMQHFRQPPLPPYYQPPLYQPMQRSKPADYRNWEYALSQPPSECERFIVLSYNILADYLAMNHRRELYFHIPWHILDWEWRKRKIVFELGLWSADIMCLQEVDRFQDLEEDLKLQGYSGIWKMRTGNAIDGCAIFWRTSRFKLVHEEYIEFNKLGLRDNVAQICVLEANSQNPAGSGSPDLSTSSSNANKVVTCNIHVLYNPKRGDIKLGQVRVLLTRAKAVSKLWNDAPVIICGDFNCTPKSPLYNFISDQQLKFSGLDRDQISGQYSAQINTPKPYWSNPGNGLNRTSIPNNSFGAFNGVPDMSHDSCSNVASEEELKQELLATSESLKRSSICHHEEAIPPINGVQELTVPIASCHQDSHSLVVESPYEEMPIGSVSHSAHETVTENSVSDLYVDTSFESLCCTKTKLDGKPVDAFVSIISTDRDPEASYLVDVKLSLPIEILSPEIFPTEEKVISPSPCRSACQVLTSNTSTRVDLDEKVVDLSLTNISTRADVNEKVAEFSLKDVDRRPDSAEAHQTSKKSDSVSDNSEFSPAHLGVRNASSSSFNSELADNENNTFDPYFWTPTEIEIASGNAECTLLEHSLKLRSTYADVEDYSGTNDSNREPQVTSYNRRFMGTVDYIWCSEGLQTVKVWIQYQNMSCKGLPGFQHRAVDMDLTMVIKYNKMDVSIGADSTTVLNYLTDRITPTWDAKNMKWGSDHIALASQLAFTKNVD